MLVRNEYPDPFTWLAERIEARSDVSISNDVACPTNGVDGSPPRDVAAAAFRVAGLALVNVVRHAPGSGVTVRVRAEPNAVDLEISDDGPRLEPAVLETARGGGRRGVPDMFAEAAACGATLGVESGATGGTRVGFAWRRPGFRS